MDTPTNIQFYQWMERRYGPNPKEAIGHNLYEDLRRAWNDSRETLFKDIDEYHHVAVLESAKPIFPEHKVYLKWGLTLASQKLLDKCDRIITMNQSPATCAECEHFQYEHGPFMDSGGCGVRNCRCGKDYNVAAVASIPPSDLREKIARIIDNEAVDYNFDASVHDLYEYTRAKEVWEKTDSILCLIGSYES